MPLPQAVQKQVEAILESPLERADPVAGGDINQAWSLTGRTGERFFLKHHASPPPGLFDAEAHGLEAIARTGTLPVPGVIAVGEHFLLLELIETGHPQDGFWQAFGEALAALHRHGRESFGFDGDNYIGLTPQPNPDSTDGHAFFAEHRLRHQGRLALERGLLDSGEMTGLERVIDRLPELVPKQPPSLIHGDLWSGNFLCNRNGEPVLIDPAAHYGWAEAELAFTTLFGGFSEAFYRAYEAASEIAPDWRDRCDIYNLYHLLNHLNLFGGGYRGSVRRILARYG
jgi:fructosamine-3-kinase